MANSALVRVTTAWSLVLLLASGNVGCSGCDDGSPSSDAEVSDASGGDAGFGDAGDAAMGLRDAAGFDAASPEAGGDASDDAKRPDDEDAAVSEPPAPLCPDAQCPGASVQLAANASYTCALRDGQVRCWGDNTNGQLGNRTRLYSGSPIAVVLDEAVTAAFAVQVEAGSDHACARLQTGEVLCWGESRLGRLGDGSRQWNARRPVAVVGIDDAVDLSVGPLMSCAVRASGAVECWGDLEAIGSTSEPRPGVETPSVIEDVPAAQRVAVGTRHACVLSQAGQVHCFGQNALGGLGSDVLSNEFEPANAVPADPAVAIAVGLHHSCALHEDGGVSCWGRGEEGQLGRPADQLLDCQNGLFPGTHCDAQPTRVPDLTGVTALSAGRNHTCALNAQGLWCWGDNSLGELGVEGSPAEVPTLVEQAAGAVAIDSSDLRSCALLDTDEVVCWGVQVPPDESVPALFGDAGPVPSMERHSQPGSVGVTAGATFSCVLDAAGAVQCWGDNALGELGDGDASRDPRDVPGIDDAVHIATGSTHACAVHDDGEVSCWGASTRASLGPARGPDARPTRVALAHATRVAAGDEFTCAVVDGGRVECFGLGTFGQIGSDAVLTPCDLFSPSALCGGPAEIPGIADAVDVVAGARHACALRESGEVVCWGSDFQQQLGDGAVAHASCPTGNSSCSAKPVRARNLDDVRALALGEEHSCALGATGRIACWGTDREGRVGLDATLVNEPTTLPAPSDASALAAGLHSCAADRQGDVWCWGQPGEFSGSVFLSFERMPTRVEGFERIVTLALGNDHLCGVDAEGQLHCMGRDDLAQLANTGNAAAPRRIDAW